MNSLLEKYFENTLTPEEQAELNTRLIHDAELRAEFDFHQALQNSISVSERQNIKAQLQQFEEPTPGKVISIKKWLPYAAIFIAIVSLWTYVYLNQSTHEELYASYFEPYPNTEVSITRGETHQKEAIVNAFSAYDLENYQEANRLFDMALQASNEPYLHFYKALCLMELNAHQEALEIFENTSWTIDYQAKATWFSALCFLKMKELTKAKEKLQYVVEKKAFKYPEASTLLSELEAEYE